MTVGTSFPADMYISYEVLAKASAPKSKGGRPSHHVPAGGYFSRDTSTTDGAREFQKMPLRTFSGRATGAVVNKLMLRNQQQESPPDNENYSGENLATAGSWLDGEIFDVYRRIHRGCSMISSTISAH